MQVVFVHGVNTRDLGDGDYEKWVNGRTDRMNRLAFGGHAEIRNPYWGKFGLQTKVLKSIPVAKGDANPLGRPQRSLTGSNELLSLAKRDFRSAIASMSVSAISQATTLMETTERHRVEDFWLSLAASADAGYVPDWLPAVIHSRQRSSAGMSASSVSKIAGSASARLRLAIVLPCLTRRRAETSAGR